VYKQWKQYRLDIRKHFFTEQMIKPWKRLPRELVDAPGLSVLKTRLASVLNNILLVSPKLVRQLD